jgi:hypothetical protein
MTKIAIAVVSILTLLVLGLDIVVMLLILGAGLWCVRFGIMQVRAYGLVADELEPDQFERSARWVGRGQLTLEDHEVLVNNALTGGCSIPSRLVDARALALDLRTPGWRDGPVNLHKTDSAQMTLQPDGSTVATVRLPRLPRGYFDGYLSAEEPENTDGWAEVRRGDGSTYWIRSR